MELTPSHMVISIPRLAGYKTVTINLALMLFGIASYVWPHIVTPDAGALNILFDQSAAALAAVAGAVNIALRMVTTSPALAAARPVLEAQAADKAMNMVQGLMSGLGATMGAPTSPWVVPVAQDLVETSRKYAGLASVPLSWPVVDGVRHEDDCTLRFGVPCNCGAHVPATLANALTVKQAIDDDFAAKMKAHVEAEGRGMSDMAMQQGRLGAGPTGPQLVRAFLLPFLLPSMLLLGGLTVATLSGCAEVQQIGSTLQSADVEQRAFALYGTFVELQEQAAIVVADKRVPLKARRAIQAADKIASPVADQVRALAVDLNATRLAYNTAQGPGDKVAVLTSQLASLLVKFGPQVSAFTAAVTSART